MMKNKNNRNRILLIARSLIVYVVFIASWIFILVAIFIIGFEALYFLKEGSWLNISVIAGLKWCGMGWAKDPKYWEGLHHVLKNTPLWLILPLVAIALRFFSKGTNAHSDDLKN